MLKKTLLILILAASNAFAQQAPDATKEATKSDQRGSDKLDIKKLEQKYWAAKDDDFSVVQNRRYVKANRFYLTGTVGVPFNDAYSTGTVQGLDFGYFWNERWGVEGQYLNASMTENDSTKQFQNTYKVYPDHNVLKATEFVSGVWVPLYAKMSWLDKAIIYFDMGVTLGAGNVQYAIKKSQGDENQNALGVKLGVFQQIFFSEHFALRADLTNTWSNQNQAHYYTPGSVVNGQPVSFTEQSTGSKTVNDTQLLFGLTYWF
jgi:outer membrane beta-barrel protein